jgi:hypothetical protein
MPDAFVAETETSSLMATQVSLPWSPADITASWLSKVLHTGRPSYEIPHAELTLIVNLPSL